MLTDLVVAIGVGSLVIVTAASLSIYAARSALTLTNYSDLQSRGAHALDRITTDIRQATSLEAISSNHIGFQMGSNIPPIRFDYNPRAKTLTRQQGNQTTVLLEDCESLGFSIYQRNPIPGTYDQYPPAESNLCKVVSVKWVCVRRLLGSLNTEVAQSAKTVLRKH